MKKHWKKRLLSGILACLLVAEYIPAPAFASAEEGLCEHHTFHTAECGYLAAVEGHECGHVHTEACYQYVTACVHEHDDTCGDAEGTCGHVCSQETGCVIKTEACRHDHDGSCGYVEATAEQPCAYVCQACAEPAENPPEPGDNPPEPGENPSEPEEDPSEPEEDPSEPAVDEAVEAVRALIEALPTLEEIQAMSTQEQAEVYTQVQKAYDAYDALTSDQKAQLPEAEEIFTSLFEYFNSLTAPAADVLLSGSCGANLTYTLDGNGTLTISGTGEMNSYPDAYSTPWRSNLSDINSIVIEDGVTSIGNYAFGVVTYPNVSSVTVPRSVTKLGLYAFGGNKIQIHYLGTMEQWLSLDFYFRADTWDAPGAVCSDGTILTLGFCGAYGVSGSPRYVLTGDGCMRIYGTGDMQFYQYLNNASHWSSYKSSIKSVVVEDGVTSLDDYAFDGSQNLTQVTLPDNLRSIGYYAFRSCAALKAIDIPSSVTYLGSGVFQASGLESIEIPEGVKSIKDYSFLNCSALSSVTIPSSVTNIGGQAFYGCSVLTDVYYGSNKLAWDQITIAANNDSLSSATIHYTNLCANGHTEETIPGKDATCTESGLTDGKKCSVCGEILQGQQVIPAGHNFVDGVCSGCGAITGSCGEKGNNLTYLLTTDGKLTISGSGKMANYTESSLAPWHSERTEITSVVLTDGVTSIGSRAFYACIKLTSVTIPDGVSSIGSFAFHNCTKLTSVTIPDGVSSIGINAFYGCSSLTSVTIPNSVSSIGSYAFRDCSSLTSVPIPDGVSSIGTGTFWGCSSLTSVTIPDSVSSIEGHSFYGCSSLTSVPIPDGVTSIGIYAFSGCSSLTSVTIPDGVSSIGSSTFSGCSSLTSVTIPDGVSSIGNYAFNGCSSLTSVTIPEGVSSIGSLAFYGCSSLTTVQFLGDGFTVTDNIFNKAVTAYYPHGNTTWTPEIRDSYGSLVTWAEACTNGTTHTEAIDEAKAPTCTKTGLTEGKHCSVCGEVLVAQEEIPAKGHTEVIDEAVEATCTETGLTEGKHCSVCGTVLVAQQVVSAKGHTEVVDEAVAPTCTETGLTEGKHCSVCGKTLIAQQVVPAAHTLNESGVCTVCGAFEGCAGTCGENLTWVLSDDGVLTITGSGTMTDYSAGSAPWYDNRTRITSVIVQEGITSIGSCAFYECTGLTSVTIPESVLTIGEDAFYDCSLTAVTFAGTRQAWMNIGYGFPASCSDGTIVDAGSCGENLLYFLADNGVLTITGSGAMDGIVPWDDYRKQITSVSLPDGITSIGSSAFYGCTNLTTITIPQGVTSIGHQAFSGSGLVAVTIPASVAVINHRAFYECEDLVSITFRHTSSDPLKIYELAFAYIGDNITIGVPYLRDINSAIGGYFTDSTITWVETETAPATAIAIHSQDDVSQAEVGVEITYTTELTPYYTTSRLVWSVAGTGDGGEAYLRAGENDTAVVAGTAPGTVTVRCASAEDDTVFGEATLTILPPTGELESVAVITGGEFPNEVGQGKTLQMIPVFTPANAMERDVTWSVENGTGTATIDRDGVLTALTTGTVTVYATAANGTEASCSVNIVRYAEEVAIFLNGKTDIRRLGIGEKLHLSARLSPEDATASGVTWSVENGTGSAAIKTYHNSELIGITAGTVILTATANDSIRTSVSVELTVTDTIKSYAVTGGNLYYNTETGVITGSDSTVTDVVIPAVIDGVTITGIAPFAFAKGSFYLGRVEKNTTLTSVSIPRTVTEIGDLAFGGCSAMTTLRFAAGSSLTTVGWGAFEDCSGLTSLTIPDSVRTVGKYAFDLGGDSNLKYLTLSGELDTRGWLSYGNTLESVTLTGSHVIGAPEYVDEYGNQRQEVLPGRNAKKVIISDSVQTIGDNAFYDCDNLTRVLLPEGIRTLGTEAFYYCRNLEEISLPNSLETIGKDCFAWSDKLQLIDLSGVPEEILETNTLLTGKETVPSVLVRATGGKVKLSWYHDSIEGEPDCWDIAHVYSSSGKYYLGAVSSGRIMLRCVDEYTGARGSKIIEVKAGTLIRPSDTGYLVSGQKLQLSAWRMPGETKVTAQWSLAPGDEAYATLSSAGLLTAGSVAEARQVTVTATPGSGEAGTKTIWILPKTTGMRITRGDDILGTQMDVDMMNGKVLTLGTQVEPEGALETVTWSSSAASVATVDQNGIVTLLRPGTAVITATSTDGSKVSAKLTLNAYYLDGTKTLTASADVPKNGLQPGQTVVMTVTGSSAIAPEHLTFGSSNPNIASVDENGVITAGTTPGVATITAALTGDPLVREASVKVTVIAMQASRLTLEPRLPDDLAELRLLGEEYQVLLSAADAAGSGYRFTIRPEFQDYNGEGLTGTAKWTSTDTSLAVVSVNADGTATVTIPAGASGDCAIQAVSSDLVKAQSRVWISVRNYAPRLESSVLTLNSCRTDGTPIVLWESYGNTVESIALADDTLPFVITDGTLYARQTLAKGTYSLPLAVLCADGVTYPFTVKVKVDNPLPAVTVKQTQKINLFYLDGTAGLTITAPGQNITEVTLADTEDFILEYADGMATLRLADAYIDNPVAKPDTKATLQVWLENYTTPVTKAITIGNMNTAPKLSLSPASSIINTALNSADPSTTLRIWNQTAGVYVDCAEAEVTGDEAFADLTVSGEELTLTLTGEAGGTASIWVRESNWARSIKLTHRITVQTKLPTAKPAASTLKLNRFFTMQTAQTPVSLSQCNLTLSDLVFTPAAKDGTALRVESDKLSVYYDGEEGCIRAKIADPDNAPKAGTYSFSYMGVLSDGTQIPGGTLKISVAATLPKVKLSASTVKLNRFLAGEECGVVTASISGGAGYTLQGFAELDAAAYEELSFVDGAIHVRLNQDSAVGKCVYRLTPVLGDEATGQEVTMNTPLTLTVQVYESQKLGVSLSAKGKLDTQNPDSAIVYTVSRLNNCSGRLDGVSLEGPNGDKFHAELDSSGTKDMILLTMRDGEEYATNVTYKIQFRFSICGQEVLSPLMSLRVTQSRLKLTASPTKLTLFQAQSTPASAKVVLSSPTTARIEDISVNAKTSAELKAALENGGFTARIEGNTAVIQLDAGKSGLLRAGKNYTLLLDVTPENNAENLKPTQIKLTITIRK